MLKVVSLNDQFIVLAKEGSEHLRSAIKSGGFLVDLIPWRKLLVLSYSYNTHS